MKTFTQWCEALNNQQDYNTFSLNKPTNPAGISAQMDRPDANRNYFTNEAYGIYKKYKDVLGNDWSMENFARTQDCSSLPDEIQIIKKYINLLQTSTKQIPANYPSKYHSSATNDSSKQIEYFTKLLQNIQNLWNKYLHFHPAQGKI